MKDRQLYIFWRWPYEMPASAVWFIAASCAALFGYFGDFGVRFLLLAAIPMYFISLVRFIQGADLLNFKARLQSIPDLKMSLDTLIKLQKAYPGKTYIGHGFDWGQEQTQLYYDFRARDEELLSPGHLYMFFRRLLGLTSKYQPNDKMHLHGIGYKEERPIYIDVNERPQHTVYSGSTGTGKGRKATVDIVGALVRGESCVIADPKSDAITVDVIYATLKRLKREQYFYFFNPSYPQSSVRLDLLNSYGSLSQVATRIVNIMPPQKDETFKNFAWRAIFSIVQALTLMGEKLTLVKVRECIQEDMSYLVKRAGAYYFAKFEETRDIAKAVNDQPASAKAAELVVETYYAKLEKKYPSKEMETLFGIYGQDQRHYQKLIQSIIPVLTQLTSGVFRELLSPDPTANDPRPIVSLKTIARTRGVLYMNLASLSDPETGASLGSFLLNDSINLVADRYYYKHELLDNTMINYWIDEASDVMNKSAISLLNKSRGSQCAVTLMLQSAVNDVAYRMGDNAAAEVALGNLNTKVQLRSVDVPTQEYMSAQCKETTVKTMDYSLKTQSTTGQNLDYTTSYDKSLRHSVEPKVPPDAFADLPNLHFFYIHGTGLVKKMRIPFIHVPPSERFKLPTYGDTPFGLLPGFHEVVGQPKTGVIFEPEPSLETA